MFESLEERLLQAETSELVHVTLDRLPPSYAWAVQWRYLEGLAVPEIARAAEMTAAEWESLCDGCARCCMIKLEDEDSGEIITSDVRCQLLDGDSCACVDYENRQAKVPDCIKLTPWNIEVLEWMPKSCAYRRIHEGRGLADWHPLVSGDPESVHDAGVSVRNSGALRFRRSDCTAACMLLAPCDRRRPPQRSCCTSMVTWRNRARVAVSCRVYS